MALPQDLKNRFEFVFSAPFLGRIVYNLLNKLLDAVTAQVAFTVGAKVSTTITVNVVIKDGWGQADGSGTAIAATNPNIIDFYLSDASTGIGVTGTAADGGIACTPTGSLIQTYTAGKHLRAQVNASGSVDIAVTHSGSRTYYLVAVLATNKIQVSNALAF